jgi:trehalose-phosphatase
MPTIAAIADAVARGVTRRHLLLLSDYDGTLCEFAGDPDAVRLPAPRAALLDELAARPKVTVGIVSGRHLADLQPRLGLSQPVWIAGLHGLEIAGPGARFLHPAAGGARGALRRLRPALESLAAGLPGVRVEDKDLALALHLRGADAATRARAQAQFLRIVEPLLAEGGLRLLVGDEVFELLPAVQWGKGDAVRWLRAFVERETGRAAWPVYLGDDVTDEAAFAEVGDAGISVVVGSRPSRAQYRLAGPPEVEALLAELVSRGIGLSASAD